MTTLTLYQTEITLGRNARVENIDVYLNSLTPAYGPVDMQYLPLQGDMVIKLARDQEFSIISDCNYAKIEQDDKSFYFFVMGADWRARKTVAFTLSMDTVNTWWDELSWNPKTTIQRQHGDRFYRTNNRLKLFRKIDFYNEGVNPALTEGREGSIIRSEVLPQSNLNWYLIYKTRDSVSPDDVSNPVSVMLLTEQSLPITYGTSAGTDTYEWYISKLCPDHTIVWFTEAMQLDEQVGEIDVTSGPTYKIGDPKADDPNAFIRVIRVSSHPVIGWAIEAFYYTGDKPQNYVYAGVDRHKTGTAYITAKNFSEYRETSAKEFYVNMTDYAAINANGLVYDLDGSTDEETIPFGEFDRADSRISKIIKLPYPPCEIYQNSDGTYEFPSGWYFNKVYRAMETTVLGEEFMTYLSEYELKDEFVFELNSAPAPWNEYLGYGVESKLYNSEFYGLSLMYDNVSYQVKLEKIEPDLAFPDVNFIPTITPQFFVANNMSSNMLFDIQYRNGIRNPEYPYDNYLLSTRNNEMAIFSSGYVDYLRNGYNYDQEANRQANRQQAISAGISVAGAVLSAWTGGASMAAAGGVITALEHAQARAARTAKNHGAELMGGVPYSGRVDDRWIKAHPGLDMTKKQVAEKQEASIHKYHELEEDILRAESEKSLNSTIATNNMITRGLDSANSVYNSIESINSNNRNMQSGLAQKQALAVNAQGMSDVDLMSIYAKNRLCVHKYTVREQDKENLARVFYYMGYAHPLQEIPNWDSRYWFNFVQCTAKFNDEQTCVYHNYLEDIRARFALGITVYHEHNGEYDFNQTKENWESFLID